MSPASRLRVLGFILSGTGACSSENTGKETGGEAWIDSDYAFVEALPCEGSSRSETDWYTASSLEASDETLGALWRNAGVVVVDLNGDEHLDIFLPNEVQSQLRLGLGDGLFVDASDQLPKRTGNDLGVGASAADYDGDGDMDLYISRALGADQLWQNDGTGVFWDVTAAAGLTDQAELSGVGSAWADMDGDGDLDLLAAHFRDELDTGPPGKADPNVLYENLGDGTFQDISDRLPANALDGFTWVGSWQDINVDGVMDLLFVNDFGDVVPNMALTNDGTGQFTDVSEQVGLDISMDGMGLGVGDLNWDGRPDFLISNLESQVLLESLPDGSWIRTGVARNLIADPYAGRVAGWGTEMADLDLDGRLDAIMSFGALAFDDIDIMYSQPDALWHQQEDGTFIQKAEILGVDHIGTGRGFLPVDLNRDGWLDLVLRDRDGPGVIYQAHCGDNAWLRVTLAQSGLNRYAVGARVEVVADGVTQWRQIYAGGTSVSSSGPPEAHFGLGSLEQVDVRVIWPDGSESQVQELPTRGHLHILHP